jgi:hypothetical protein
MNNEKDIMPTEEINVEKAWEYLEKKQECHLNYVAGNHNDNENKQPRIFRSSRPVILGDTWKNYRFLGIFKARKKIPVQQNHYPLTVFGSSSSGKTYVAATLAQKWIANNEGVVWLDIHRTQTSYNLLLNFAQKVNRLDDIYVLKAFNEWPMSDEMPKLQKTHSIDPINPLIGNIWAFKQIFGQNLGAMLHEIALVVKNKGYLLDAASLKSMLSWHNLLLWQKNSQWGEATQAITDYLQTVNNNIQNHVQNCMAALQVLQTIETYTQKGLFSVQPDIDLEDIFIQRKIVVILLSDSYDEEPEACVLNKLFSIHVHHASKKQDKDNIEGNIWQNIVMIEPHVLVKENAENTGYVSEFFSKLAHSSNWIFAGYTPYRNEPSEKGMVQAIKVSNSILMMLSESHYPIDFPDELRVKVLGKIIDYKKVLADNSVVLKWIKPGDGYFFTSGRENNASDKPCIDNCPQYYFHKVEPEYYKREELIQKLYSQYHNENVLSKHPISKEKINKKLIG